MQSFKNKLEYFREKESTSLHKYVLRKMNSQSATERRQALMNKYSGGLRKKTVPIPCISKTLYEKPVRVAIEFTIDQF
jgi:hypothetical protein